MQGDFTRDTFAPDKHFLRVLLQQGRVQLDADWNEQVSILLHYMQTLARDLIGPYGGPTAECGFTVSNPQKNDFTIDKGRYYVNGILCENPAPVSYSKQTDYPSPLSLSPEKNYLVYLDVWETFVSPLQDPAIREIALGNADSACRSRVVWQVKVHAVGGTNCADAQKEFLPSPLSTAKLAAQTKAPTNPAGDEPCIIAPDARYRGLENRLYRLEIHTGSGVDANGNAQTPTFKWSRDNASHSLPLLNVSSDAQNHTSTAQLADLGNGCDCQVRPGDWVELLDDSNTLLQQPGSLLKVLAVNTLEQTVMLDGTAPALHAGNGRHPILRRWDYQPAAKGEPKKAADNALEIKENQWLPLEQGIQIFFEAGGTYRSGDYWLIPARTETGDIEWPRSVNNDGVATPLSLAPHGVVHHYAPLALLSHPGAPSQYLSDCRKQFAPLVGGYGYYSYGWEGIGAHLL